MPDTVNPHHVAVIQLLYDNLAALPHTEYGVINMLPFAHDTQTTRTVKRQVCEALVELLDNGGYLKHDAPQVEPLQQSFATVRCRACHSTIAELSTDAQGSANVVGALWIAGIAARNSQCPHGVVGPEDLRLHMEREFRAVLDEESADES